MTAPRGGSRIAQATIGDAWEARRLADRVSGTSTVAEPGGLYLRPEEIEAEFARRPLAAFGPEAGEAIADAVAGDPAGTPAALASLARTRAEAGDAVVVCLPDDDALRDLIKRRLRPAPDEVESWEQARHLPPGRIGLVRLPLTEGFRRAGLSVLAALGATPRRHRPQAVAALAMDELRVGDLVVEPEHGLARLTGLALVDEAAARERLSLEFAGDTSLLVAAEEAGRIWRYGSADAVAPRDRLSGDAWRRRRAEVEAEIATTAAGIVARLQALDQARAPNIEPPRAAFERFTRRVPYALTEDQQAAIEAALADMARERPMQRLVCGDVGFGKTEVALHVAVAAVLAGRQVALAAPTTLLARQHLETFRRRTAGLGIEVAPLIRSTRSAEARAVLRGMKDGSVGIVVGTQALASPGIQFAKLGLVVIDEEQRFGEKQKHLLGTLRQGVHALTMSATPLPRSLQSALIGLYDLSLLTVPPVARQPVRGFVLPFDPAVVRAALMREARRGGQSFVVCPRIEDIAPLAGRLAELVPELVVAPAHGKMRGEQLDRVMLHFAQGRTDVLLSTSIIEAGLDIPNANTMLVWRPDRFGLAQLHQLRGRVGRGRARAVAYLLTDPAHEFSAGARKRLERLAALDRLGAGFAVSAADLDLRGAGDLLGEAQSGHLRLMGSEFYGHLLSRAVMAARDEVPPAEWVPEIALDVAAFLPSGLVPEPDLRLDLYRRLARLDRAAAIDDFAEELEDRFGAMPDPVGGLLDLARVRLLCRALGVAALHAGPEAVALSPREATDAAALTERLRDRVDLHWSRDRLILDITEPRPAVRLARVIEALEHPR